MEQPVRSLPVANRDTRVREPLLGQVASIVELFVWLLVLKGFFLPLFQIPTGSMAETLMGTHATHTCPNCGIEYLAGFVQLPDKPGFFPPALLECPNCRWQLRTAVAVSSGVRLEEKSGDRIMVHGWSYDLGGWLAPRRWDVVVFKNPNDATQNYIKRLIGLPGETIEIVDGDVWVTPPGGSTPALARKTRTAQEALWMPVYDNDFIPAKPSQNRAGVPQSEATAWSDHHPRWTCPAPEVMPWTGLDTRRPRFDGLNAARGELTFVTQPGKTDEPGTITDQIGYNAYDVLVQQGQAMTRTLQIVTDVRVSTDVAFEAGEGFVELAISKYYDVFRARLAADGALTLEHFNPNGNVNETWGQTKVDMQSPCRLSLGHADGRVVVEANGKPVLTSPDAFVLDIDTARKRKALRRSPRITIAAERVQVTLDHVRIDRDVHYTTDVQSGGNGVEGRPLRLRDDAYFVLGDNSSRSADGRFWLPPRPPGARAEQSQLGPHLWQRLRDGNYTIGTVPADQLLGRAFLVYWPGFMPLGGLPEKVPNFLPDFGRVRWIH
jgi:signal peptidase I